MLARTNVLLRLKSSLRALVLPVLILSVWWFITYLGLVSAVILPSPEKVIQTFVTFANNGQLWFNLSVSFGRVVKGFLIGVSAGLCIGSLMGASRLAEKLIGPLFHAVRQVPILGWIPLLILVFGIKENSKIAFIALGSFYPMALNTFEGARSLKKEYYEVARVFEYTKFRLVTTFLLPAAVPAILTGIRTSLSESWMLVVGAEMFASSFGGIGEMIWLAKDAFHIHIVLMGIICIGTVGFVFNWTIGLLEVRLLQWRKPA